MSSLRIKQLISNLLGKASRNGRLSFYISYVHNRHRLPNFNHPRDLSEIWIKRVLDGEVNNIANLADKYAVRQYVKERGLEDLLTPLIAVYDNADEVKLSILPTRFAMKSNSGASHNIICTDKSELNEEEVRSKVRKWLKPVHYSETERHYNLIKPKVVCEAFIDDGTGGFPVDYKFMCIHGKVHCILGVSGREQGHGSYLPYTTDWQPIREYYRGNSTAVKLLPKPSNLDEMISTAEILAEGIDLVRVDLYSNGTRIWFGEMTLTPAGCIFHRWTQKALDEMGQEYNHNKK